MAGRKLTGGTIVINKMRIVIGKNASHDSVDGKFHTTSFNGLLSNG